MLPVEHKRLNKFISKFKITTREREIINLILNGKTNKEISDELYISIKTVKNSIWRIFKKTNVKNRGQLTFLIRNFQSTDEISTELADIERETPKPDKVILKRKPITSNEITLAFRLKKVFKPLSVIIVLLAVAIVGWQVFLQKELDPLASDQFSIAILPFDDLSPQRDQEYLCDGLVEEIISRLTKIRNLRIPARTSSFLLKGKRLDIKEIGTKLKVENILEGSVRKAENRLRITVQLINVKDNKHIWSEKYERDMQDIFSIQDEISLAIVKNLKIKIFGEERDNLTKQHTESLEAYNLYLKGQWFLSRRTADDLKKAIMYFEKVIEIDSNYTMAYIGLANSYVLLPDYSSIILPLEAYKISKEAVTHALEIDITLAEAHATLAQILYKNEYDWNGAEKKFKHALELNPAYSEAQHWYAFFLMFQARFEEAIQMIERAKDLDPLSLVINRNKGAILFYARRYNKAINELKKTLELDPHFIRTHYFLGRAYLQKSMFEEALVEFQKEKENVRYWDSALEAQIGITYVKMSRRNEAEVILDTLIEKSEITKTDYTSMAVLYFALGENDQGFKGLEEGYKQRESLLKYIKIDPRYDSVRSDPRFKELVRKIGL